MKINAFFDVFIILTKTVVRFCRLKFKTKNTLDVQKLMFLYKCFLKHFSSQQYNVFLNMHFTNHLQHYLYLRIDPSQLLVLFCFQNICSYLI